MLVVRFLGVVALCLAAVVTAAVLSTLAAGPAAGLLAAAAGGLLSERVIWPTARPLVGSEPGPGRREREL